MSTESTGVSDFAIYSSASDQIVILLKPRPFTCRSSHLCGLRAVVGLLANKGDEVGERIVPVLRVLDLVLMGMVRFRTVLIEQRARAGGLRTRRHQRRVLRHRYRGKKPSVETHFSDRATKQKRQPLNQSPRFCGATAHLHFVSPVSAAMHRKIAAFRYRFGRAVVGEKGRRLCYPAYLQYAAETTMASTVAALRSPTEGDCSG